MWISVGSCGFLWIEGNSSARFGSYHHRETANQKLTFFLLDLHMRILRLLFRLWAINRTKENTRECEDNVCNMRPIQATRCEIHRNFDAAANRPPPFPLLSAWCANSSDVRLQSTRRPHAGSRAINKLISVIWIWSKINIYKRSESVGRNQTAFDWLRLVAYEWKAAQASSIIYTHPHELWPARFA